jgi:hypothetical protein
MLALDGRIVGDDPAERTSELRYVYTDSKTGKPVANITRYAYVDGIDRYAVTVNAT